MPKISEIAKVIREDSKEAFKELSDSAQEAQTCPCGKYSDEVVVNGKCHICNTE